MDLNYLWFTPAVITFLAVLGYAVKGPNGDLRAFAVLLSVVGWCVFSISTLLYGLDYILPYK